MTQRFWHAQNLPFVESRRACESRACYKPHTHHTLSIGAVDAGRSLLKVADYPLMALHPGDVVIIPAHCVHACNPDEDASWSYQMLYLDCSWLEMLVKKGDVDEDVLQTPKPVHFSQPQIYQQYCATNALLFDTVSDHQKEEALIALLGELLLPAPPPQPSPPDWLAPLLVQLQNRSDTAWSLEEMAQQARLSRYHFIRVFRTHTGLTPHAYLLDCRVNQARTLLQKGFPLSEMAYQLGFSDQSHFQRAFRERVSVTPGEYQRQLRR